MNHRSNKRIIQLANTIRESIDGRTQQARTEKLQGFVRLFIVGPNDLDKGTIESEIYNIMEQVCNDEKWTIAKERKTLVLEHSMAAVRLGFEGLNNALAKEFSQSFRDGDLAELKFLMTAVDPLINAYKANDDFQLMKLLRDKSPLLRAGNFSVQPDQREVLTQIKDKVAKLAALWDDSAIPKCIEVYRTIAPLKLFDIPERIERVLEVKISDDEENPTIKALSKGLDAPYTELLSYWSYVTDNTQFATHQGIKGLEYDRVSVIMDDASAGGSLFSYEKLFGAKATTDTDRKNSAAGKDTVVTRTLRLFYVTCTRAKESLALIAYTSDVEAVKQTALSNKWFEQDEVIVVGRGGHT